MRVILMQVNISESKAVHIHSEQVIYRPTAIQTNSSEQTQGGCAIVMSFVLSLYLL